jgi:hypothetical protein
VRPPTAIALFTQRKRCNRKTTILRLSRGQSLSLCPLDLLVVLPYWMRATQSRTALFIFFCSCVVRLCRHKPLCRHIFVLAKNVACKVLLVSLVSAKRKVYCRHTTTSKEGRISAPHCVGLNSNLSLSNTNSQHYKH